MTAGSPGRLPILRLTMLTFMALYIHGYHLGVEDGEIYLPSAKKLANPALYPFATEFFLSHGHLSQFSRIVAWTSSLCHLPIDWAILIWYLVTLFCMLASSWLLCCAVFRSERARWSAILIITAVLAMPATNTGLLLMDPYLTARSFSTPLTLYALASFPERKFVRSLVALLITASIHPLMVVYLIFLIGVMWLIESRRTRADSRVPVAMSAIGLLPMGFQLLPATGAYREALYSRDYYFLFNWSWYHWLGMLAPLAFLAWFWKGRLRGVTPQFHRLSFAMLPFGLVSIAVGLVFSSSHAFDMFARLQPLRSFHLITIVFVLLLGGVLGEYWRRSRWVIAAVSIPLALGMFVVARETYPRSPQVEWPSANSSNAWVDTLLWVRRNTPSDTVFAVDSRYFIDADTDLHGFRAVAERSALADYIKDGGVAAMFPGLAPEWKQMSNATYGLNHFTAQDFQRLRQEYPEVSWTVVHGPAPAGLACPYESRGYAVCRLGPQNASQSKP